MRKSRWISTLSGIAALTLATASVQAAAIFTTDFLTFTSENPGLALEDFENADVLPGIQTVIESPLNSSTDNSVFASGAVKPGFSLIVASNQLFVSRDAAGNAGAVVSSGLFAEDMNITFAPGVTALGLDLMQYDGNDDGWSMEVFDTADVSLGMFATASGSFVGITSVDAIGRIFIDKPNSGGVIDNLRFGAAGAVAAPEPLSLVLLGLGLAGLGAGRRNRRG